MAKQQGVKHFLDKPAQDRGAVPVTPEGLAAITTMCAAGTTYPGEYVGSIAAYCTKVYAIANTKAVATTAAQGVGVLALLERLYGWLPTWATVMSWLMAVLQPFYAACWANPFWVWAAVAAVVTVGVGRSWWGRTHQWFARAVIRNITTDLEVRAWLMAGGMHNLQQAAEPLEKLGATDHHRLMFCPHCAMALRVVCGEIYGTRVEHHWHLISRQHARYAGHHCPVGRRLGTERDPATYVMEDLLPLATAFVYYKAVFQTCRNSDMGRSGGEEGLCPPNRRALIRHDMPEGVNRTGGKYWKKGWITRERSNKRFANSDYEYLEALLDQGLFDMVIDEATEMLMDGISDDEDYDEDYNPLDDTGGHDRVNAQRRHAQSLHRAQRDAVGFAKRMLANRRRPEGCPQTKGSKVPSIFCGNEFQLVDETGMSEVVAEYTAGCKADYERHAEAVKPYLSRTVAQQPEAIPKLTKAEMRNERRKERNARKRLVAPEGTCVGSVPLDFAKLGAACAVWHDGIEQAVCNGLLVRLQNAKAYFITCRHAVRNNKDVDRFAGWAKNPQPFQIALHRPHKVADDVRVLRVLSNGDDRVLFELEYVLGPEWKNPAVADVKQYFELNADKGTAMAHMCFATMQKGQLTWQTQAGTIKHVSADGKTFYYAMTTIPGTCRAAVYTAAGKILGGHFHPGITFAGLVCPGAVVEDLQLPKSFCGEYTPMPIEVPDGTPQAKPLEEHDLGVLRRGRTEPFKVYPLKPRHSIQGVDPRYVLAKPSTEMLHKEVARFWEPMNFTCPEPVLRKALKMVNHLEQDCVCPFQEPTLQAIHEMVMFFGTKERTSAGASGDGANQKDYLLSMSTLPESYSEEDRLANGAYVVAKRIEALYAYVVEHGDEPPPEDHELADLWTDCKTWNVQGKKDGYKPAKLLVGRSIQCPTFEMKVLWKLLFGPGDDMWNKRDTYCRVGYDFNRPVPDYHAFQYVNARAVLAFDETAFDRYVPAEMLNMFFMGHLPLMFPGVPTGLLKFLRGSTVESLLMMTDGQLYLKKRGNPSGFMNTLRLNCFVQLLVWCAILVIRSQDVREGHPVLTTDEESEYYVPADLEGLLCMMPDIDRFGHKQDGLELADFFLEICGDDSRLFVHSAMGMEFFDVPNEGQAILNIWKTYFPWAVKIEGIVVFGDDDPLVDRMARVPPFIGRQLVVVNGHLWSPVMCPSRCLKRLVHDEGRSAELEFELKTAAWATLALHVFWHLRGQIVCPAAEWVCSQGVNEKRLNRMIGRYYNHARAHCQSLDALVINY